VYEGRIVVVTGGSSGIGLATARAFAAKGADIAIVARNLQKLERAKVELEKVRVSPAQRFTTVSTDLSDGDAAQSAADSLVEQGFLPDILVNSAGVIIPGEFVKMTPEEFDHNFLNGFDSVVHPCRAFAPRMIERGSGHIVNVSSVAGFLGIYGYTGYAAAKYAVMGFSEALRFELRPYGVHVHVACPPDTDTPALAHEKTLRPPETERIAGTIKAIPPERVADAIVRGVAKDSHYIIPDITSRFYFRLKGLVPELFFAIVDRDVHRARREQEKGA